MRSVLTDLEKVKNFSIFLPVLNGDCACARANFNITVEEKVFWLLLNFLALKPECSFKKAKRIK